MFDLWKLLTANGFRFLDGGKPPKFITQDASERAVWAGYVTGPDGRTYSVTMIPADPETGELN